MSKNTDSGSEFDFSKFDADPELSDKRNISVPPPNQYFDVEQVPSGFTPMGEVAVEGRMYRGLSHGRMPWGIIVISWVAIGLPILGLCGYIIYASLEPLLTGTTPLSFQTLFSAILVLALHLLVPGVILFIVIKGTRAKLRYVRSRSRRGE
ncbi:hypothetical protein NC981_16680 [Leptolyngbya sp. DQ-M1]|uniref:hypothetical protein n=1 Tax=Leptolyngbya sp. DQ-M1 TaxID=2933920 RepID=UPI003297FE98